MSAFTVESSHSVRVNASDDEPITLLNEGDTLYYGQSSSVSADSHDGSLTSGQSLTLTIPTWIRSASQSYIQTLKAASGNALSALERLSTGPNLVPYFTGPDTASTASFTAFGRSLVDDSDAATARGTLGTDRARIFNMLDYGAVHDGATSDLTPFQNAVTAAGSTGIVYFPHVGTGTTTYYMGSSTSDLAGVYIAADPDVTISMPNNSNPNFRTWKPLTPVNIVMRGQNTITVTEQPNINLPAYPGATVCPPEFSSLTADDFTTWEERDYTPSSGLSYTVGSSAVSSTARVLTIHGTITSGHIAGAARKLNIGQSVSASAVFSGTPGASAVLYVMVQGTSEFVTWHIKDSTSSTPAIERRRQTGSGWTSETTFTPQTKGYLISASAFPTIKVRRTGRRKAALSINGTLIDEVTLGSDVIDAGFYTNPSFASPGTLTFNDAVLTDLDHQEASYRVKFKVVCFGDSITYGAGQTLGWVDYLPYALRGQLGIPNKIEVTVEATNGQTAGQIYSSHVSGFAFSGYHYALILPGTNDIGNQTPIATFQSDIQNIANACVAGGVPPIFGIPPMQTNSDQTGYGTDNDPNRYMGGPYRSAIAYLAASNGWPLANSMRDVGAIGISNGVLYDNTHPNERGSIAIARAFAKAIVNHRRTGLAGQFGALRADNAVVDGDLESTDSDHGLILASPDGTRYRVTVDDTGTLGVASA